MEGKGLRARQAEETHATLITVARELFTDPGYAATSIEDIIQRAGVARGALYHHFSGKDALFRAVYDSVQAEAVARVMAAAARRAGEPWTAVRAGLSAFLDACLEPTFRRVVIVDSIPVLHQAAFEAGVGRNELPMLRTILTPLVTAHLPDDVDVEPLAYVTLGGLYGAALFIATSPKPKVARRQAESVLDAIMTGLRTSLGPS